MEENNSLGLKNSKEKIIIVGTSVTAKHVYDFVTSYDLYEVEAFAVDSKYKESDMYEGLPVYPLEDLDKYIDKSKIKLFIAILWNRLNADRRDIYLRLKGQGYSFVNIISPKASVRGTIQGDNCWIHDFVVIQKGAVIRNNTAIMAMALVGADVIMGDHCFMGAKSVVAGGSTVGEQCFIGINCTIFDDTSVGNKCILGACTVVKRNVPDCSLIKTASDLLVEQYRPEEIENKLLFRKNIR